MFIWKCFISLSFFKNVVFLWIIFSLSLASFGIFFSLPFYSFTMLYLYLGFFYSTGKNRFISVITSGKFSILSSIISFPQFFLLSSFRVQSKYFLSLLSSPYLFVSFIFSVFLPLCASFWVIGQMFQFIFRMCFICC